MNGPQDSDPRLICKEIINALEGLVTWKYDDRFGTLLTEFGAAEKEAVQGVLERFFSITWDSDNITHAPEIVRVIDRHLGGLRPGQLFFNTNPDQDAFVFCAWWPWGDGQTISIRLAPFDKKLSDEEKAELIDLIRGWADI
jgi:hypothetical protein